VHPLGDSGTLSERSTDIPMRTAFFAPPMVRMCVETREEDTNGQA